MRASDSVRGYFVGPGQDESNRETKQHHDNDEPHGPARDLENRKGGRRNLDEKPADGRIRNRNLVNFATLQLRKETPRIHGLLVPQPQFMSKAGIANCAVVAGFAYEKLGGSKWRAILIAAV